MPAGLGQFHGLFTHLGQVHAGQFYAVLLSSGKLPHAVHSSGHIVNGQLNGLQLLAATFAQVAFRAQQGIGVQSHRRSKTPTFLPHFID